MNDMRLEEEHRKQTIIMGMKLLHYGLSIAVFYFFWILFRYGQLTPVKSVGFRYNYFTAIGFAVVLLFFTKGCVIAQEHLVMYGAIPSEYEKEMMD